MDMSRIRNTVSFLSLLLIANPCAAILLGTETSDFSHVGSISSTSSTFYGGNSATLISPNWVLTAAHNGVSAGQYFNSDLGSSLITAVYDYPSWFSSWDLALVSLDTSINHGWYPSLNPTPIDSTVMLGADLLSVGYGNNIDSPINGSTPSGSGIKRYGFSDLVMPSISDGAIGVCLSAAGSICQIQSSPALLGVGDSGGATFLNFGNGWVLSGVNSYLTTTTPFTGGVFGEGGNLFADISGAYNWIEGIVTDDLNWSQIGQSYDVSTIPIPGAAWLFGSGLLSLVGIARRKKSAAL